LEAISRSYKRGDSVPAHYYNVIFKGEKVARSRKEIENDLRNGLHPDDAPLKYWIINDVIYLSKAEMPEEIRNGVEADDQLEKEYDAQSKRYFFNGVEYDSLSEIPKKYRSRVEAYVNSIPKQEKYRYIIQETPLLNMIIGYVISGILILGSVYLFLVYEKII